MVQVIIQIQRDKLARLHERGPVTAPAEVLQAADDFGATLAPVHPGTGDPALASYFSVDVPDQATADRLLARLRQSDVIEAAYVKPPEAMP